MSRNSTNSYGNDERDTPMTTEFDSCPEWCNHGGTCAHARAEIQAMEMEAENAWVRAAENRYDPEAEEDLRLHEFLFPRGYANPTFDTDEPTCWRGHVIAEGDDGAVCRECVDEDRRWGM